MLVILFWHAFTFLVFIKKHAHLKWDFVLKNVFAIL